MQRRESLCYEGSGQALQGSCRIEPFNFEINEGEIVGLLGPNGSGKSTAINCLLGLLSYDEGEVEVFGRRVSPDDMDTKQRIGFVPQDLSFFAELSVIDNIRYFAGLYEQNNVKRDEMVREAIAFVGLEKYEVCRQKVVRRQSAALILLAALPTALNLLCLTSRPSLLTRRAQLHSRRHQGDESERFHGSLHDALPRRSAGAVRSDCDHG